MDPSLDPLSNQTNHSREGMVGDQEASKQGLPSTRSGINWTRILAERGLESPGYHEVIAKMKQEGRIKSKAP